VFVLHSHIVFIVNSDGYEAMFHENKKKVFLG